MLQFDQYFAAFPLFMTPITSKCAKSILMSPPVISFHFFILEYLFKGLLSPASEKIMAKIIVSFLQPKHYQQSRHHFYTHLCKHCINRC